MKYQAIQPLSKSAAESAVVRNNPDELLRVVIAVALHSEDSHWVQEFCLGLAAHPHPGVRGNAILGFGHIARRFGKLDQDRIRPLIEQALSDANEFVRGQAEAAADDVEFFLGWNLARPQPGKSSV